MNQRKPMGPLPPPPTRMIRDDNVPASLEMNRANTLRWMLKMQCWMLIAEDRKSRGEYVH